MSEFDVLCGHTAFSDSRAKIKNLENHKKIQIFQFHKTYLYNTWITWELWILEFLEKWNKQHTF